MTKKEIQDYKDKRNLKYGFNAYWNKGFNEAITLLNKQEEAINYTHSCTELVCVDDGDLPNLTQDNIYKMIVESNKHYNIIDDNGNDVLISKKYLTKTT